MLLVWPVEFKENFWNHILMNLHSPQWPWLKIIITKEAAVPSIVLELACTSWWEPSVHFSGIVQTSPRHIGTMKIFTPQKVADSTNQDTSSPFLPEGASYYTLTCTSQQCLPEPFACPRASSSPWHYLGEQQVVQVNIWIWMGGEWFFLHFPYRGPYPIYQYGMKAFSSASRSVFVFEKDVSGQPSAFGNTYFMR